MTTNAAPYFPLPNDLPAIELPESIPAGMRWVFRTETGVRGAIRSTGKSFRAVRSNGTVDDVRRVSSFRTIAAAHAFILKGES